MGENVESVLACTVCLSTRLKIWGEKSGFSLYECDECSHIFADIADSLKYDLGEDEFRESFTHGLMKSDHDYYLHLLAGESKGMPTNITSEHIMRLISQYLFRGMDWLDVGCGSGLLLEILGKQGVNSVGIEPGGWGQIAANKKKIKIHQAFLSDSTFNQKFDVVSATDVIEHIPTPLDFIKLLTSYLKCGGYLVLTMPFADSIEAKIFRDQWDMVTPPTHNQFFGSASIAEATKSMNLSVENIFQYNIKNLKGAGKFRVVRYILDKIVPGSQAICILKKIG